MRKIRLVKVVKPEIVGYLYSQHGENYPDYRCGNEDCGLGVGEGNPYCSYCGSELDWSRDTKVTQNISGGNGNIQVNGNFDIKLRLRAEKDDQGRA